MKRKVLIILAGALVAGVLGAGICAQEPQAKPQAPWKDQIHELGYLLIHISTINVVNGLNLSREQIVDLRKLAKKVEEAGAKPPVLRGELDPRVRKVRDAFLELREVVLEGKDPDEKMHALILEVRGVESDLLREGLCAPRPRFAKNSCARCHMSPSEGKPKREWNPTPAASREMATGHYVGLYGRRPYMAMALLAKKVDDLLTDSQREVFGDFSCCLIPPSNLRDPVRVGQASIPDWALDTLRKVREIPGRGWPKWRDRVLDFFEKMEDVKRPDVTDEEREALRKRMTEAMEEARGLSEFDFELAKEDLCKKLVGEKRQSDHATKRAFFLLSAGSVAVYDAVLKRMDRKPEEVGTPTGERPRAEQPKCKPGQSPDECGEEK
ncbi:MAG: hypothetical protein ACYTAF_01700 [Planctomycetota bacterium]|jgi:hypothetical protein